MSTLRIFVQVKSLMKEGYPPQVLSSMSQIAIDGLTKAVMVCDNMYLTGNWSHQFDKSKTFKSVFRTGDNKKVSVHTMRNRDCYKYSEWSAYDAVALEMPYANSDISMLIVLPNKVDGLQELEHKLISADLIKLTSNMKRKDVQVELPRFEMWFEVDLKEQFSKLGIKTMFDSENANLSRMLEKPERIPISVARQYSYLGVFEDGSKFDPSIQVKDKSTSRSLRDEPLYFRANHPFFFAIHNTRGVYFAGHVAKL